jgi:hypothetical protein
VKSRRSTSGSCMECVDDTQSRRTGNGTLSSFDWYIFCRIYDLDLHVHRVGKLVV